MEECSLKLQIVRRVSGFKELTVGTHSLWIKWPSRSKHGSKTILVNTEMGHLEFGLFKNHSSIRLEHLVKLIPFILCIEEDSYNTNMNVLFSRTLFFLHSITCWINIATFFLFCVPVPCFPLVHKKHHYLLTFYGRQNIST